MLLQGTKSQPRHGQQKSACHDSIFRQIHGTSNSETREAHLTGVAFRLFDGNSPERAASKNAFILFHDELLMVFKPCLVITDLEELRVEFGTGSAAHAQAVINRR
jgi:hypothetical protein